MTQRKTPTRRIVIAVPTTFKAVADRAGCSAQTIANRYQAAKAENPRKVVSLETLTTPKRRPRQ